MSPYLVSYACNECLRTDLHTSSSFSLSAPDCSPVRAFMIRCSQSVTPFPVVLCPRLTIGSFIAFSVLNNSTLFFHMQDFFSFLYDFCFLNDHDLFFLRITSYLFYRNRETTALVFFIISGTNVIGLSLSQFICNQKLVIPPTLIIFFNDFTIGIT